nr:SusC/RagA family TonB-linked outer membrane protein [Chitinophaga nivalis]
MGDPEKKTGSPASDTLFRVSGIITDVKGQPLTGVTVHIRNTTVGTTTDGQGKFTLQQVPANAQLAVSMIGYLSQEVAVNHRKNIPVSLQEYVSNLDETVVIAYGATTKRFNTGNVSSVKAADIAKQPVSNPLAALQGRVPGMIITQQTGLPGGGYNVQIRGQNSIASGNDPLYIIDGVPYSSQITTTLGGTLIGGGSPLNFINPADIESIDVLKDADATAIYGSRGANGVVLITTKKGTIDQTRISLNAYGGIGIASSRVKLMNREQYLEMRHEAFRNDGVLPGIYDHDLNGKWDTTRSTDWQKELLGNKAHFTDVQLSISGGNNNIQYLIGGNLRKETTVFSGKFADKKGSVHFNLTSNSRNQKIQVMLSGNYMVDDNRLPNYDLTGNIYYPPVAPQLYNKDGTLNWQNSTWENPLSPLNTRYSSKTDNLLSNVVISYEPIKALKIKLSGGYNNMLMNEITTLPTTMFDPALKVKTGSASFADKKIQSWILEPQISYQRKWRAGNFDILLGTTIQQSTANAKEVRGLGYNNDALLENIEGASTIIKGNNSNSLYKYNAIFARINCNWDGKYLLNITARRDGSSRFGPGNQFGNFGAVGAGWIFSEENFMKDNAGALSFGKIRASYGTTGNDQISDYRFLSLYQFSSDVPPYQGSPGLTPSSLYNPDYGWEVNKKMEIGIELGLLKDKIFFSTSYYRNRSSNQLLSYPLPDIVGLSSVIQNLPATVENNGWEILLKVGNKQVKKISWSTTFQATIPRNKLISFPGMEKTSYATTMQIGQPLSAIKVLQSAGVNETTGNYQFLDFKGNPTSMPDISTDQYKFININPVFYGGIQQTLQYKNFELDFLFQFVKQTGKNYLYSNYYAPGMSAFYNVPAEVTDRWQKPGDKANFQKYTQKFGETFTAYQYAQQSDLAYSDASYIRLKNLSLTYMIPDQWKNALHLQQGRVYIQGQNLLTITNYKGPDPETQSATKLPPLKVWTIGFQLTF